MSHKWVFALAALGLAATSAFADEVDLDALRAATEKYKDVNVALADGFIADPSGMCVTAEMEGRPAEMGGMGIHYLNPARLQLTADSPRVDGNATNTDFLTPSILLYEPQPDGSLVLVGVENLVFEKAWKDSGHDGPPMLGARMWDHMADDPATAADEAHGFMPHYDQHIWLYRDNPAGMFEPFNPQVNCAGHSG